VTASRLRPRKYLWDHSAWPWQPPSNDFVPDVAAFTEANNSRALRFAIDAITAQPLGYAKAVAGESVKPFVQTNAFRFPVVPLTRGLGNENRTYPAAAVRDYTGSTSVPYLGHHYATSERHPYTNLMNVYQRMIFLPGPLFGVIVAIGLAGLFIPRRRTAAGALLWISAAIAIVLPIAEHEYTYRYVIPAVPLVCMAAALVFRHRSDDQQDHQQQQERDAAAA
jgi:hypothetical protein